MPSQISRQPEARSTSRVVNIPASGMSRVMLTPGQQLEFSFDPAGVTFSRSDADLVIAGANGAGVTLSGFFVAENADSLPQFILPGGDSVPASAYLQSLNIDITTAAGPTPTATPPSSGEGEYADGAGDLLGGVERLGSLGTDQWAGAVKAAEAQVNSTRLPGGDAPGIAPDTGPDGPPTPVDPPLFNARAVLYMQNEGDAPNGEPYAGRGVTVQALAKNANGQWEASGQEAASIQAHKGNTLDVDSLLEYTMDRDGNITFRLTAAGKAWLAANGKDMVAYYTITDANGNSYVIQVVISADGTFDSSSEHNENLDPNGLAHGEWHDGKDMSKETDYKTTSSNLSDDLRYTGKLNGAEISTGYAADNNWGNDSVTVNGELHNSSITSGSGKDVITISGGMTGSTIVTGAGSDVVKTGDVTGSTLALGNTAGAVDTDGSQKDDQNFLNAGDVVDSFIYGTTGRETIELGRVSGSTIVTGAGSDKVTAASLAGSTVGLGNTTDKADADSGQKSDYNSLTVGTDSTDYKADAVRNSSVYGTTGLDSIRIHGHVTGSAIDTGSGKFDSVDILGSVYSTGASDGNSIKAAEGYIKIDMQGTDAIAAVSASGANARNVIESLQVNIHAGDTSKAEAAYGVLGQGEGAANSIIGRNILTVEAKGDTAYGVCARDGASNSLSSAEMQITAAGKTVAYGVAAQDGGSNSLTGGRVLITATGAAAHGVSAQGTGASSSVSGTYVAVTATGKTLAQGAAAQGDGALTELSSLVRMDITATTTGPGREDNASARAEAGAFGLYAADGGKVTAETKDLHINATAKGEQWAVGARAEDGCSVELTGRDIEVKAKVEAVDKTIAPRVHAFALETYNGDITVNMTGHSRNTLLLEAENRLQTGKANGDNFAAGIFAEGTSHVLIKGDKNATNQVTIKTVTEEGGSVGVYTFGKDSDVSILGGDHFDDITIDAASNTGAAVGIRVSENTSDVLVDTGKGGDLVTIRAHSSEQSDKTYSHAYGLQNTGGTITVRSLEGTVDIGAFSNKSNSYAVSAAGPTAVNTVEARRVDLKAESNEDLAMGMYAQDDSRNTVVGTESVNLTVQGGIAAYGLSAKYGSANSITGGTVDISVTGNDWATGVGAWGGGRTSNAITADKTLRIEVVGGNAKGVSVSGAGAQNTLKAGELSITASGKADSHGLIAQGEGANSLSAGNVEIAAGAGWAAYGLFAQGNGSVNTVTADNRIDITSTGNSAVGMHAENHGRNEVSAKTVTIKADGTGAFYGGSGVFGLHGGSNAITAGGDVEISATGGYYASGMSYLGKVDAHGVNSIGAKGDVKITASGASTLNHAMHAERFGGNEIREAKNVILQTEAAGASSCVAMYASGRELTGAVGAFNSIHDVEGAVTLIAKGAVGSSEYHGGNAGMLAYSGGRNEIFKAGSVDIQVETPTNGMDGYGMKACGSTSQGPQEMNHIHDITGNVSVTVDGGKSAYGMYASDSGTNLIENTGSVEILATGREHSYAMYAKEGGTNTITNNNGDALIVVIKATGGSLGNYAMFAEAHSTNQIIGGAGNDVISLKGDIYATDTKSKNIIDTGAGDDRIELDGKVTGNFTLDAGDGYDTLVLRASSWAEFTDRYQAWLEANFDTMNIESFRWALDGSSEGMPFWLSKLFWTYSLLHPFKAFDFGPLSEADLAHIAAGDMNNIIDHDGDVSAVDTTRQAGDGHGPAAFGDGDDYVHVKGNVDHVDFSLGGGHNILHVGGNALGDIFGGHDGNDIRVGGSFGGVIDLGSGGDRVALGGLHCGDVSLGAGDDHLVLNAFTGGTVDGGSGHDILTLNLGGHAGAGAFAADGTFSGLFTPGAVQNFEELHFNLSGGGDDSLEIDGLLDSLRGMTGDAQTTVRITGDAGSDQVDTQALANNGWTSWVDSVTGDTRWTHAGAEDENLVILIQNGLG